MLHYPRDSLTDLSLPAHNLAIKLAEATTEYRVQKDLYESFTASLGDKTGKWQTLIDNWNEDPDGTANPYEYPETGKFSAHCLRVLPH